jgi:hypothetical protein
MRRTASVSVLVILFWSLAASANAQSFKNCTEVRKVYPMGVAKTLVAAKKQKNYPINNPFVSAGVYASLAKLDRDKDGTACEK